MTTLSYACGVSDRALLGETIGVHLGRAVAEHGDRDALVECASGRRWTYRQLVTDVDRVARALLAQGIEVGDRVGIWAPNCAEWVLVQYATARIGAILVNINPAYRAHELAYVLDQSGVRMLVHADATAQSDYPGLVAAVAPGCATLTRTVCVGTPQWDDLLAGADAVDPDLLAERSASLGFDDPINIQYTSGTTGFPKGATLSHHNILNNGYFVAELVGYGPEDRVCLPVPLYHCFGMVMGNLGATTHGACIVLPAPDLRSDAPPSTRWPASAAPRSTASPRCSSPSSHCPTSRASTCPACAPASWPAPPARSRS